MDSIATIVNLLVSAGLVSLIYTIWKDRRSNQESRRQETEEAQRMSYHQLQEDYFAFLRVCLQRPELGMGINQADRTNLDEMQSEQQLLGYEMLLSVFEHAYIGRNTSPLIYNKHWPAWDAYIYAYCTKPSFQRACKVFEVGPRPGQWWGVETDFEPYLMDKLSQARKAENRNWIDIDAADKSSKRDERERSK